MSVLTLRWITRSSEIISKTLVASMNTQRHYSEKSTVINDEVDKFVVFAKEWWDVNGPTKPLHLLNHVRVPFAREQILTSSGITEEAIAAGKSLEGFKIIDVGCGAGIFSEALAKIGADVTGLDAGSELIKVAEDHAAKDSSLKSNLRYVNSTVENYVKNHREAYDALVCSEVIEHVEHPEFFVAKCVELVKPKGSLIFTTINKTLAGWFTLVVLYEYVYRLIPRGTHHYKLLMPPEKLSDMLTSNGCQVKRIQGMFIRKDGSSTLLKSTNYNYGLHAIKMK